MLTFKQLCNDDPKVAIKATIDGLLGQDRIGWLKLDMSMFAGEEPGSPGICCACAASLAILELKFPDVVPDLPIAKYTVESSRAKLLEVDADDLRDFECAIDYLRQGGLNPLYNYFGVVGQPGYPGVEHDWCLRTDNWEEELHLLIYFYEQVAGIAFVPALSYDVDSWQQGVFDRLATFKQSLAGEVAA